MKLFPTIVASAMFIIGLVALSNAGPPALLEALDAANVSYVVSAKEGVIATEGVTIHVLTDENVCDVLAQHPGVPVSAYNSVTGNFVECK